MHGTRFSTGHCNLSVHVNHTNITKSRTVVKFCQIYENEGNYDISINYVAIVAI